MIPPAPEEVEAYIGLTWKPSQGAVSYNIKRAENVDGPYTNLATGVTTNSYIDQNVVSGRTYYYAITAVNSAGESERSIIIEATVNIIVPDPDDPGNDPNPGGPGEPQNPDPDDPPGPQPAGDLVVQYRAGDTDPANNQIRPHFNIVNTGSSDVRLSDLKLRYYFTKDGPQSVSAWIDWAQIGSSNIQTSFTDTYVELSFTTGAGILAAGSQTGDIQLRISKDDWSNFDETDDYSFDPTKTSYTDWERVTLYQNGTLVWGVEPH